MEPGSSFGLTAAASLVCVVLGFAAFVLWFFARLDRAREEALQSEERERKAQDNEQT